MKPGPTLCRPNLRIDYEFEVRFNVTHRKRHKSVKPFSLHKSGSHPVPIELVLSQNLDLSSILILETQRWTEATTMNQERALISVNFDIFILYVVNFIVLHSLSVFYNRAAHTSRLLQSSNKYGDCWTMLVFLE